MIPAPLYTPLYYQIMLVVVVGSALLYSFTPGHPGELRHFNVVGTVVICVGVVLFMGLRPISVVFIDMRAYAGSYEHVQAGEEGRFSDPLFNVLMRLCAPFLSAQGWFVFCAFIYIAPLALAARRVHGAWGFPVFLAFLTSLSFWAYGVNGIRNGMAGSVLILAFAFHDRPLVMLPVTAAACAIHASVLLPAGAFLLVRYFSRTEAWLAFWAACAVASFAVRNLGERLLSIYNPFASDSRVEGYIVLGKRWGFRADFLAYSIFPVLATLVLAAPTRAALRRFVVGVRWRAVFGWPSVRSAMRTVRTGATRGGSVQRPARVGAKFDVRLFGRTSRGQVLRSGLAASRPQPQIRERSKTSTSEVAPSARATIDESPWDSLPWVRMLRSDAFYARLVNTYLVANAVWILVINANCSNRFAYLSWFMLPWVLLYPFVPGRFNSRPRTGLIAAVLGAQYLFTCLMEFVVYPLRGMQ